MPALALQLLRRDAERHAVDVGDRIPDAIAALDRAGERLCDRLLRQVGAPATHPVEGPPQLRSRFAIDLLEVMTAAPFGSLTGSEPHDLHASRGFGAQKRLRGRSTVSLVSRFPARSR